jgi:hypothetical protein
MLGGDEAAARGRGLGSTLLVLVTVLLAVTALVLSYGGRALLRPGPFADRTVAALRDPSVQAYVADHVTDAVVQSGTGDLVVVRPIVRSLAGGIVGGGAFAALLRRAIQEAHMAVVEHDQPTLRVRVADVGTLIQGVLERFAPGAARTIGAERIATLLSVRPNESLLGVVRIARRLYSLAWLLVLLALAAASGRSGSRPAGDARRSSSGSGSCWVGWPSPPWSPSGARWPSRRPRQVVAWRWGRCGTPS